MARRTVVWTETAARQRREVLRFWLQRNRSNTYPKKLMMEIRDRLAAVCEYPESGFRTPHGDTRMIAMGKHSIYYLFDDERIVVMAFWDNRQDPDKLLGLLTTS